MAELLKRKALQIVERLDQAGYEAYLVGGCVRDEWLHRPVKDYDIATSALPEQVMDLFERTVPTGLQHGTVTVVKDRIPFEVTTFRKEAGYEDHRRPSAVEYIDSLMEDLRRRDFTMNAMALDHNERLIDPFDGQGDLKRGVLRCVGHAKERFGEDALRMLRCIRFAAEYQLDIEASTWNALLEDAPLLRHIAMERVRAELERMLGGYDPNRSLLLILQSGVLQHTKQPLQLGQLKQDRVRADLKMLGSLDERLAYLYLALQVSPGRIDDDLRALTFPNPVVDRVRAIAEAHAFLLNALGGDPPYEDSYRRAWVIAVLRTGKQALQGLLAIYKLDEDIWRSSVSSIDPQPALSSWLSNGANWIECMPVYGLHDLALSGGELLSALQTRGGPWTRRLLNELLEQTALGQLDNQKETLLHAAKKRFAQMQEQESL